MAIPSPISLATPLKSRQQVSVTQAPGFGKDVVMDYVEGIDRLDFNGIDAIGGLNNVPASPNTVLILSAGGSGQITLVDVTASNIGVSELDVV